MWKKIGAGLSIIAGGITVVKGIYDMFFSEKTEEPVATAPEAVETPAADDVDPYEVADEIEHEMESEI